jgi:adenosylhomocysteine nucleosidase
MLLRHLVNTYLRQAAQERLQEAVSEIAHGAAESASQESEASAGEPPSPCAAALVFALGVESGGFVDLLEDVERRRFRTRIEYDGRLENRRVLAVDSGVGAEAAARAAERVITRHQPSWIVSAGFAGALREDVRRGQIIMPTSIIDAADGEWSVGLKMDAESAASTRGLHLGGLLTVDHIVRTPEARRRLAEQHGAIACDMETAAVAEVCRRRQTRFLAVRVISDGLEDELPPELAALVSQKSTSAKLGAAAGALFHRPSSVKDMWRLKEDAVKASDRLAKFLLGVLRQLDSQAETNSGRHG